MAKPKPQGATAPRWDNKNDPGKLQEIALATQSGSSVFKSPAEVAALLHLGLVEQNSEMVDPADNSRYATRATPQGVQESGIAPPERANNDTAISAVNEGNDMSDMSVNPQGGAAAPPGAFMATDEATGPVMATGDTAGPAAPKKRGAPPGKRGPRPPIDTSNIVLGHSVGLPMAIAAGTRGRKPSYPFENLAPPVVPPGSESDTNQWKFARFFVPETEARKDPAKLLNATVNAHNKKLEERKAVDPRTGRVPKFAIYRGKEAGPDGAEVVGAHIYRIQ